MFRLPARGPARLTAVVASAALAAALAGCSGAGDHGSATSPGTPRASATAASAAPTPVALPCDRLLTPEQSSSLHPALNADAGYRAPRGSLPAQAASMKGVACGWTSSATGKAVAVAVARPAASSVTQLDGRAATQSHVVPTYGIPPAVQGYFAAADGVGTAQVFASGYWVIASSPDFLEPGDAQPVMAAVIANLPH